MAIERKSVLKKAPSLDVVEAIIATSAEPKAESGEAEPKIVVEHGSSPDARRRGPGRLKSVRRMEGLSTRIEIGLRDEVDAYIEEHNMTLIGLIDRALRAEIARG